MDTNEKRPRRPRIGEIKGSVESTVGENSNYEKVEYTPGGNQENQGGDREYQPRNSYYIIAKADIIIVKADIIIITAKEVTIMTITVREDIIIIVNVRILPLMHHQLQLKVA